MREVLVKRRRLHPGQERLKASKARFKVAMFGRRWGKNVAAVDEAMELALAGKSVGWFEPTYKYFLVSWLDLCTRLAPVIKHKDDNDKRLELITGGLIEGWTCDTPDPGRSRKYHKAIINEAGIIRGLMNIWEQSIRATLTDYAGDATFYGTPKGRSHDFTRLYAKAASTPGWKEFRGPTAENPYIPREEIAAAKAELPPQVFAQEYEGIPADDGGNPFGLDAIAACTMQPDEWKALQYRVPVTWGWDFGRAQDFTVGVGIGKRYEVTRLARWQLKPWGETYRDVAKLTGERPSWGDSTGIGDVIVESLQRMGCPMQGYVFSRPSKQKLMERLASAIQQRLIKIPPGVIVSELETFGYEYTHTGIRYSAPDGLHDDAVMALALAVYGRDQLAVLPEDEEEIIPDMDQHPGFDAKHRKRRKAPWERKYEEEVPQGWPGAHSGFHLPRQDELMPASDE